MKDLAKGVRRLSQRAAEIRQAVADLPRQTAEVRDAVVTAAGQVQQARTAAAEGVAAWRGLDAAEALAAVREVAAHAAPLAEAGFALAGVECDLGPVRRVRIELRRAGEASAARQRALLAAHAHRPVLKAVFAAILQARDAAEEENVSGLEWDRLVVDYGGAANIRLGWTPVAETPPSAPAAPAPSAPVFAASTFFEPRTGAAPAPAVAAARPPVAGPEPVPPAVHVAAPAVSVPKIGNAALARFKQMPDLTKRRPSR